MRLILAPLLFCSMTWAQTPVAVSTDGTDVSAPGPAAVIAKPRTSEEILPKTKREEILAKAGLEAEDLAGMDEMDRDLFLLHARREDLVKLQARYPKIKSSSLEKLKSLLKR